VSCLIAWQHVHVMLRGPAVSCLIAWQHVRVRLRELAMSCLIARQHVRVMLTGLAVSCLMVRQHLGVRLRGLAVSCLIARQHVRGGSPREGARSELASGAATGGGGPQAPPTRNSYRPDRKPYWAPPIRITYR
jgi:hypothetical protein